jgi:uncharacterized protein YqeY
MSHPETSLKLRLSEQTKSCMKSGDKETLSFCRNLHAAVRKKEIDDRVDLDDAGIQKIVSSLLKQRQEALVMFQEGKREDLVAKEAAEIRFLQSYLPAQMSEAELKAVIDWAVTEAKASSPKDLGNVMKLLMPKTQGKADGKLVNQLVKERMGIA